MRKKIKKITEIIFAIFSWIFSFIFFIITILNLKNIASDPFGVIGLGLTTYLFYWGGKKLFLSYKK